jgi:hypothetical protein
MFLDYFTGCLTLVYVCAVFANGIKASAPFALLLKLVKSLGIALAVCSVAGVVLIGLAYSVAPLLGAVVGLALAGAAVYFEVRAVESK